MEPFKSPSVSRIQLSIRKAFTDATAVLQEWETAQCTSSKILASLVNASQRRNDYAESVGKLGVLTNFVSAEHLVQVGTLFATFSRPVVDHLTSIAGSAASIPGQIAGSFTVLRERVPAPN
jgi:hypothetical protein